MKSKIGDRKEIIKFAWFPIRIKNKIIWLRNYKEIYEYKLTYILNLYDHIDCAPIFVKPKSKKRWVFIKNNLN